MSVWARLRASQVYTLDPLVAVLITFQILVNFYLAVRYSTIDPYIAIVNVVFIAMTISGLILHHAFCGGIKIDKQLVPKELSQILMVSSLGFLIVLVTQTIIFRSQTSAIAFVSMVEAQLFYSTAGVSEETFFRYYIQTKAEQSLPLAIVGAAVSIGVTSLLFTTYHFGVYGTLLLALYAVFLGSLVLGATYAVTKRLSVPMIIHVAVNVAASGLIQPA